MEKKVFYIYGWIFVRPIRYFFWRMIAYGSFETRWVPRKSEYWPHYGKKYVIPNFHWVLMYKTVFIFFKWIYYDGWRPFCDWTGGHRRTYPLVARIIHKIGKSTAGYAISGGECFHCGFEDGDKVELSCDETGEKFVLEDAWSCDTQDGTDHRFRGTTICPVCGYRSSYEDGSL